MAGEFDPFVWPLDEGILKKIADADGKVPIPATSAECHRLASAIHLHGCGLSRAVPLEDLKMERFRDVTGRATIPNTPVECTRLARALSMRAFTIEATLTDDERVARGEHPRLGQP